MRFLGLSYNPELQISWSSFLENVANLRDLFLTANPALFSVETPFNFTTLVHLRHLSLSACKLTQLPSLPVSLQFLDLSNNDIPFYESEAEFLWENLENLERIDLSHNHLLAAGIPRTWVKIPSLREISMFETGIQKGDAKFQEIFQELTDRGVEIFMGSPGKPMEHLSIPYFSEMTGKRDTQEDAFTWGWISLAVVAEEKYQEFSEPYSASDTLSIPRGTSEMSEENFPHTPIMEQKERENLGASNTTDHVLDESTALKIESETPITMSTSISTSNNNNINFNMNNNNFDTGGCLYIGLFDGHGGAGVANICAKSLSSALWEALGNEACVWKGGYLPMGAAAMRGALANLQKTLENHPDSALQYQGATALILVVVYTAEDENFPGKFTATQIFCANLGDTRAVLKRGKTAHRISRDHKPWGDNEEERVSALRGHVTFGAVASKHEDPVVSHAVPRVNGLTALSRALGDPHMEPWVSRDPHVARINLTNMDSHVIIACDGVWDVMLDHEVVQLLDETLARGESEEVAAKLIRDVAYVRNSDDNITVLIVKL